MYQAITTEYQVVTINAASLLEAVTLVREAGFKIVSITQIQA